MESSTIYFRESFASKRALLLTIIISYCLFGLIIASPPRVNVTLSDPTPVKAGNVTFTLDFNETMNTTINATVQLVGSSTYNVTPLGWSNSTQWTGWYNFSTGTGEGHYTIVVAGAQNPSGETVSDSSNSLTLDTTSPTLTINSPLPNITSATKSFSINATASDTNMDYTEILIYTASGSLVTGANSTVNGNFLVSLSVSTDGNYSINATTHDLAGNLVKASAGNITVDSTGPAITLTSPVSNSTIKSALVSVDITVSDEHLNYTNISIINSTGSIVNSTNTSQSGVQEVNLSVYAEGTYRVNVTSYDALGNSNTVASTNVRVSLKPLAIITLNDTSPVEAGNVSFTLDFDRTMNQLVNATVQITGSANYNITPVGWSNATRWTGWFNFTNLTGDGRYTINLSSAEDLQNISLVEDISNSFILDNFDPIISITSPATNSTLSSMIITINLTVTEANLNYTNISIINSTGGIVNSTADNSTGVHTITLTVSSNGVYNITATAHDLAGKTAVSNSSNVTVQYTETPPETTHHSGGGGSYTTISVDFWSGTTEVNGTNFVQGFDTKLAKSYRVKVKVGSDDHYVGVVAITENSATINISSDPQQVTLSVGQETRVEVNNDGYYDIYLKLNSIKDGVANITIKGIYEKISGVPVKNTTSPVVKTNNPPVSGQTPATKCTSGLKKCVGSDVEQCLNGEWVTVELCSSGCDSVQAKCIIPPIKPGESNLWKIAALLFVILLIALYLIVTRKPKGPDYSTYKLNRDTNSKGQLSSKVKSIENKLTSMEKNGHDVKRLKISIEDIKQDIYSGLQYIAEGRLELVAREMEFLESGSLN